MTTETAASGEVGLGRGGRMSRQRKRDAVLRLLRGEDLETLSRTLGATAATLTGDDRLACQWAIVEVRRGLDRSSLQLTSLGIAVDGTRTERRATLEIPQVAPGLDVLRTILPQLHD